MRKKRNRKVTGRTVEWQKVYERNITKDERANGSPYWAWMEKNGPQNEDGEIIEFPKANPDSLGELEPGQTAPVQNNMELRGEMQAALTDKQWAIIERVLDGFSQIEIARELGLNQSQVSKTIKISYEKIRKYFGEDVI